jgi:hypothetical protein
MLGASAPLGCSKWTEIATALSDAKTHDDTAADLVKQAERGNIAPAPPPCGS